MKILLSWLREFVDVPGSAQEIGATMSTRGFAVEGIEPAGDGDAVIDFEVTANRPDCMSVMGMAREIATAYGLQVRRPAIHGRASAPAADRKSDAAEAGIAATTPDEVREAAGTSGAVALHLLSLKAVDQTDVPVEIENPELCPRYAAALATVTVGESPAWMQARLRAAGVRPISNIVDVTNYVLIELGQPMHAFDSTRLGGGRIHVRTARDGESIRTLDGQTRALTPEMLVIADAERPVAVAGVMGGADSEVSATTKTIVLESAYFNPLSVRRTSRKLGLKTEASMRFERGADPRLPVTAMERACALIAAIGAGQPVGTVADRYPARVEPKVLRLRRHRIAGLLGIEVSDAEVRRILDGLGFALRDAADGSGWDVTVPTRRVDVVREVDLLEEVARHVGFERIPATFPVLRRAAPAVDPRIVQARTLRGVLTGAGFFEAVTFGFIGSGTAALFAPADDLVPIANPLSETFAVLRPSLLPGIVEAVGYNRRREQRDIRLFEIGNRFSRSGGERRALACAWIGASAPEHWGGGTRDVDFFDIKGLVERICGALGIEVTSEAHRTDWLVNGRGAALKSGGAPVGLLGQLAPAAADRLGLPTGDAIYVAEIDLDAMELVGRAAAMRVVPLPRYPSVTRDVSILVDAALPAARVRETVRRAAPAVLTRVIEFDRYQGRNIPEDKVSLSLRLVFRSADRTLTDAEVQGAMEAVIAALQDTHGAVQR